MIRFPKIKTFEQHGGGVFVPIPEPEQREKTKPDKIKIITKKVNSKPKTTEKKKGSHCCLSIPVTVALIYLEILNLKSFIHVVLKIKAHIYEMV